MRQPSRAQSRTRVLAHYDDIESRESLQQVRSFDTFHRDQGLARSDLEGAFEQVCSKVAVGDDSIQFRLPEDADPQALRNRTRAAWLLWIGHLAALDDVMLDHHLVSGVAAEDAPTFPHATPTPNQPARQAAQKERHCRRDATASQWVMFNVPVTALLYSLVAGLGEMLLLGVLYGLTLKPAT